MPTVSEDLVQLEADYNEAMAQCQTGAEVTTAKARFMGKVSPWTDLLKRIGTDEVPATSRASLGHQINEAYRRMIRRASDRMSELQSEAEDA